MGELSREEILSEAQRLARSQFGGTLATIHADDGTPYPAFVFFHPHPTGRGVLRERTGLAARARHGGHA